MTKDLNIDAVTAARQTAETASVAYAAGQTAIAEADVALAALQSQVSALEADGVTGSEFAEAQGRVALHTMRLPALAAAAQAAQAALHGAEGQAVLAEFASWYYGDVDAVTETLVALRSAVASFVSAATAHNAKFFEFRQKLQTVEPYLEGRMTLAGLAGILRIDGQPLEFVSVVPWLARLAGEGMLSLPNREGAHIGGDLANEGRVVIPADPALAGQPAHDMPWRSPRVWEMTPSQVHALSINPHPYGTAGTTRQLDQD